MIVLFFLQPPHFKQRENNLNNAVFRFINVKKSRKKEQRVSNVIKLNNAAVLTGMSVVFCRN